MTRGDGLGERCSPALSQSRRRRWTREAIIRSLDAWHSEHLRAPAAHEWWLAGPRHPSHFTVRAVFGSWNAALQHAGMQVRAQGDARIRRPRERCPVTGRFIAKGDRLGPPGAIAPAGRTL